jgi:hypothetical protein
VDGRSIKIFLIEGTASGLRTAELGLSTLEPQLSPPIESGELGSLNQVLSQFTYVGEGFSATCVVDLDAGQFVVKAGSLARKNEGASLQPTYKNLRAQLRQSGVLVDDGSQSYRFVQDYAFTAATAAAQVVSGQTMNGRLAWKIGDRTFAQWEDESLGKDG